MLVEHTFVTTLDEAEALHAAAQYLYGLGFLVQSTPGGLHATRGKANPTSRKVVLLPQTVDLSYDRGRVMMGLGILPRGNKDKPCHALLMKTIARHIENILVTRAPTSQLVEECRLVESQIGTQWHPVEKPLIGCLLVFIGLIVIVVILGVAGVFD